MPEELKETDKFWKGLVYQTRDSFKINSLIINIILILVYDRKNYFS